MAASGNFVKAVHRLDHAHRIDQSIRFRPAFWQKGPLSLTLLKFNLLGKLGTACRNAQKPSNLIPFKILVWGPTQQTHQIRLRPDFLAKKTRNSKNRFASGSLARRGPMPQTLEIGSRSSFSFKGRFARPVKFGSILNFGTWGVQPTKTSKLGCVLIFLAKGCQRREPPNWVGSCFFWHGCVRPYPVLKSGSFWNFSQGPGVLSPTLLKLGLGPEFCNELAQSPKLLNEFANPLNS